MFGAGSEGKRLKNALQISGCDMELVKSWMKDFDRMCHQLSAVTLQYEKAVAALHTVQETTLAMEHMLVQRPEWSKADITTMNGYVKTLRGQEDNYLHAFLVSREDREFTSTYASVIKQGTQFHADGAETLLLQSEIENLLALIAENSNRPRPDMQMLTYFFLHHSEDELEELSPTKRMERIAQVYENEYEKTIRQQLAIGIQNAKALSLHNQDKRGRLQILLDFPQNIPMEEQVELLLDVLKRG